MAAWYDSLPDAGDVTTDLFSRSPELDVLDRIFGGGLSRQTRSNLDNFDEYQASLDRQAKEDEDRYRDLLRKQRRSELSRDVNFEPLPLADRTIIGLGQGALGLGRQVAGLADALYIPGARGLANAAQEESNQLQGLTDTEVPDWLGGASQWLANNATSVLPSMVASVLGGMPAAALAAAGQTFGSMFEDAQDSYIRRGFNEGEAKKSAYIPSVIGAIITGVLTKSFGPRGVEALARGATIGEMKAALQRPIQTILTGVGSEATEEGLDQLAQGIIEKKSYNPDKTWGEVVQDALSAGAAGGILGGLGEVASVGRLNVARGLRRLGRGGQRVEMTPEGEATSIALPEQEQQQPSAGYQLPDAQRVFQMPDVPGIPSVDEAPLPGQGQLPEINRPLPPSEPEAESTPQKLSIGAKILMAMGIDQDVAIRFSGEFDASNPTYQTLEDYRDQLMAAANESGLRAPGSTGLRYEDYIAAGLSQDEAAQAAASAEQNREAIRQQNRASSLRRGKREALPADQPSTQPNGGDIVNEGNQGVQGIQEGQQEGVLSPAAQTEAAGGLAQNTPAAQPLPVPPVQQPPTIEEESFVPATPTIATPEKSQEEKPDIIDYIRDNIGRIKGEGVAKAGTEGYYGDNYKDLLRHGRSRSLLTNKGDGNNWDEVVDDLRRAGYLPEGATVDDLQTLIVDAAVAKKAGKGKNGVSVEATKEAEMINEGEKQLIDFEEKAYTKRLISTAVPVNDLVHGDKFNLGGEEFVVEDVIMDPETDQVAFVQVKDGKKYGTQVVPNGRVLYTDKNSYRPNEDATEFVPKSERELTADEIRNIDRQINELREKENLTQEEFRRLEMLEQQRGQEFMKLNDPRFVADEQAQQAEVERQRMLTQQAAPLTAPDLRTQQDMFSKPDQSEMFNQPVEEAWRQQLLNIISKTRSVDLGKNPEAVAQMITQSKLPTFVKDVALAMLKTPALKDLNWSGVLFGIADDLPGAQGVTNGKNFIIKSDADAQTFVHELAHILYTGLPAKYKAALTASRLAEVEKAFGSVPDDFRKGMSSYAYAQNYGQTETYHLSNDEEYLATYFGNKFAQDQFAKRNQSSFTQKLKEWFLGIKDAIQRVLGIDPDRDRIMRELLAGRFQPTFEVGESIKASFRKDAADAQNAARLMKTEEARETEGHNSLAQSTSFIDLLVKHGARTASLGAQKILKFGELIGIQSAGVSLIGEPLTYQQVKQRTSGAKQKLAAYAAATQMRRLTEILKEAVRTGDKAAKEITKPGFIKRLEKRDQLKIESETLDAINRITGPVLENALKMAQAALKQEAKNDVQIAQLEAQLREIMSTRSSSAALSILVRDFVDVLSSSPEGIALLSNPDVNRGQLVEMYRDLKRSADQPLSNNSLLNFAGLILSRNAELRDQLWAAKLARNSSIRAGMGAYETKLADDMERNPRGTIMREIREARKRQKKEDFAKFAFRTLNKEIVEKMEEAGREIEAAEIASSALNDPEMKALEAEIYRDAGVEGTFESMVPGKDDVFPLPSGKAVDISMDGMRGTKVKNERWAEWDAARNELKEWLAANPDHPDYGVHEKNLFNLELFYLNESVLNPHDREQVMEGLFNTVLDSVRNVGGHWAGVISKLVPRWSLLKEQAGHWSEKYSKILTAQRLKTLRSHGLKWKGEGGEMSKEAVNLEFYVKHMNQVIYSLNREADKLRVGDVTQSGMVVTQEDLDDAHMQHLATKAGFQVVEKNLGGRDAYVIDKRSGYVVQRRPGKTEGDIVPRKFDEEGQLFLNEFVKAREEYRKATDEEGKRRATRKQIELINKHWDQVAYPYLWDRNPNFALETPFDGMGNAYEQVAQKMQEFPGVIRDWDRLIEEVVGLSAMTPEEVESTILNDLGRIFENGLKEETDSGLLTPPITGEKKNTFTRARGAELLPYSFYTYGFKVSKDVHGFAGMIHSRAYEKVLNGLNKLKEELEARQTELKARAAKVGMKKAIDERKIAKANNQLFDDFDNLDTRLANVNKLIAHMTQPEPEDATAQAFARFISGVQGSIIGNLMTTARNLISGPKYAGFVAGRLNAMPVFSYPHAAFHLWGIQGLAATGRLAQSVTLGAIKTLPQLGRAVRAFAQNKDSRIRSFLGESMVAWLNETGKLMYERQADIMKLQERGLGHVQDVTLEWQNRVAAGFLAGGELLEQEVYGFGKKLGLGMAAVIETINTPIKGMFSALGEHALNAGIVRGMEGKMGHIQVFSRALDKVFDDYKAGKRKFDFEDMNNPLNFLNHKEALPAGKERLFSTEQDLKDIEAMYQDAGLSFQNEAWKYLKQRNDGVEKPEFIPGEARDLLANYILGVVNKSTPMQQPIILQGRSIPTILLRPLMGWSSRTLNGIHRLISTPSSTGNEVADKAALNKARIRQFLVLSSFTLLPMFVMFAGLGVGEEWLARKMTKGLWNQERSSRYPWEREGLKSQAIGWGIAATYGIPFVDMGINTMLNDMPGRASLDPNVVMINKFKDVLNYIGGAIQTGNPGFGLARLVEGFYPDSRIVLNRINSETGKRQGADVVALIRRSGPQDLVKPMGGPMAGPNYTALSPYGQAMENAAINGNFAEVQRLYDEAVEKARVLGKENPEKLVRQVFQQRNPFTRALKQKMSDEQYQSFLSKLSPDELKKVQKVVSNFDEAGQLIGTDPTFTKEERKFRGGGGSSGGGGGGSSYVSTLSRASRRPASFSPLGRPASGRLASLKAERRRKSLNRLRRRRTRRGLRRA